jgi:hypothetical protein
VTRFCLLVTRVTGPVRSLPRYSIPRQSRHTMCRDEVREPFHGTEETKHTNKKSEEKTHRMIWGNRGMNGRQRGIQRHYMCT